MTQRDSILRTSGFVLFLIGIILGICVIMARAWPDMESTFYGFVKYDYPSIPSLSCPVLMTSLDRLPVTIRLKNSLDRQLNYYVSSQFSTNLTITTKEELVQLAPGETRVVAWEVSAENVDLHNFIFANVFISANANIPMRASTCGTLVINLPFTNGPILFYGIIILAAVVIGLGLLLWMRHKDPGIPTTQPQSMWMQFVAIIITVGVIAGILNWWFIAILTLVLMMLALGVFLLPGKKPA